MLTRSLNFVFASSLLGVLAVLGGLAFAGAGTADADPLAGVGTIAIDAEPTVGGINTSTSIGTIQNCVSIPVGGSATVEVVVDSIPVYTFVSGGIAGWGFNILYPNTGPGALNITAKAGPLAAADGKSLISNLASSQITDLSNAVPDSDGNFKSFASDSDADFESGTGRLYYLTVTSVGGAGVATLDLSDTDGGDGDAIPDVYDTANYAYSIGTVGDAYVVVGGTCPPPTPSPTPAPPGVGGEVSLAVTAGDSSAPWLQWIAIIVGTALLLGTGIWVAKRRA